MPITTRATLVRPRETLLFTRVRDRITHATARIEPWPRARIGARRSQRRRAHARIANRAQI
jgi:hypothetical protein